MYVRTCVCAGAYTHAQRDTGMYTRERVETCRMCIRVRGYVCVCVCAATTHDQQTSIRVYVCTCTYSEYLTNVFYRFVVFFFPFTQLFVTARIGRKCNRDVAGQCHHRVTIIAPCFPRENTVLVRASPIYLRFIFVFLNLLSSQSVPFVHHFRSRNFQIVVDPRFLPSKLYP